MPRYREKHISISTIILVVLLVVACIGGSLYFINSKRELNDDNLLSVDEYQIVDEKTSIGLKVDVKEDGKIYVSGKASEDWEAVIQTVTLDEGTYTVGGCNSNVGTYGIVVKKDGTPIAYAGTNGTQGATFTVDASGTYTVSIFVMEDTTLYRTFAPTLASGKKAISFYE